MHQRAIQHGRYSLRGRGGLPTLVLLLFAPFLLLAQPTVSAPQPAEESEILADLNGVVGQEDLTYLGDLVRRAGNCCVSSSAVADILTGWLRENHAIYRQRGAIDIRQFRAFLLRRLADLPAVETTLNAVRSELLFAHGQSTVAAAAVLARTLPESAAELMPLLEPFLSPDYRDEWVDLTTPTLGFELSQPTTARREILHTLLRFEGPPTESLVSTVRAMLSFEEERPQKIDPQLSRLGRQLLDRWEQPLPSCCQAASTSCADTGGLPVGQQATTAPPPLRYSSGQRTRVRASSLTFTDQDGRAVRFQQLRGKPFVLTFFYTHCTNPLKCAATIDRLAQLQDTIDQMGAETRFGLYALTYDPTLDTPLAMKSFGQAYGLSFDRPTARLLSLPEEEFASFAEKLDLRVNYGRGTINHHGVQLFVFDRKGRVAAEFDNQGWSVGQVVPILTDLGAE